MGDEDITRFGAYLSDVGEDLEGGGKKTAGLEDLHVTSEISVK